MTHILVEILRLFAKFGIFIVKKLGINGILCLVLLLELPVMFFYYTGMRYEYRQECNYSISKTAKVRKLSIKKDMQELEGISVKKRESYYLVELKVNNRYSRDILYMSVTARNQDGDFVTCMNRNYYDASGNEGRSVIPAGATGKIFCVITLTEAEIPRTDEIILRGWTIGEEDEAHTVAIDFASIRERETEEKIETLQKKRGL